MLGLDEALVHAVLDDWRTAPVDDRIRAALAFLEKLTLAPDTLTAADRAQWRAAGLSDQALMEAAYVCFLFSVMDRAADAFDFAEPDAEGLRATGEFLYNNGYKTLKLIR